MAFLLTAAGYLLCIAIGFAAGMSMSALLSANHLEDDE